MVLRSNAQSHRCRSHDDARANGADQNGARENGARENGPINEGELEPKSRMFQSHCVHARNTPPLG